jgi:iron complex transport system permease protein
MSKNKKLILLTILLIASIALFIGYDLNPKILKYSLSKRVPAVFAILITGSVVAFSSVVFQTVTNNRILTPSVLGLDSLYMFIQTVVVFFIGSANTSFFSNTKLNFFVSLIFMSMFSMLLFKFMFKKETSNIFFLLLVGMIMGTLFGSMSSFMQMLIDPADFSVVQGKMFASFNNINYDVMWVSFALFILVALYLRNQLKYLDVMSLGRDDAINLGVDHNKVVNRVLLSVSILTSVSTALVGPITFLGILVANLSREIIKTYKHKYIIATAMLISCIALILGQFIVSKILNFNATIGTIINFVGGLYFIYIMLKESKQ